MRSKIKHLQSQLDQEKNRADDLHEQLRLQEIRNIEGHAQLVEGDQRVFEREITKMRTIISRAAVAMIGTISGIIFLSI